VTFVIPVDRWIRARAFMRRDVLQETSYKLQCVFQLLALGFQVLTFYFLSRLVGGEWSESHLARYGGDYFTFVLIGLSFTGIFNAALVGLTTSIRQHLTSGALEAMAATPTSPLEILAGSLLFPFTLESIKTMIVLVLGWSLLGAEIEVVRPLTLVATLLLALVVFGSIGIISASMIVYFKRGDPVAWFLAAMTMLVGGVLFPTSVLPGWLEKVSDLLPTPYAVDALRACLMPEADGNQLAMDLLGLCIFGTVLVPLAAISSRFFFERARANGSLGLH